MATVTAFTAARMLAIENGTVVSGEIVGDDLILETRGGTTINAGVVKGAKGDKGDQGDPGEVTADELWLATDNAKWEAVEIFWANNSVLSAQIAANAVTTAKIANGAVTLAKLASFFVQGTAPTGVTNGIWFDTAGHAVKRWSGSAWVAL